MDVAFLLSHLGEHLPGEPNTIIEPLVRGGNGRSKIDLERVQRMRDQGEKVLRDGGFTERTVFAFKLSCEEALVLIIRRGKRA